MPVEDFQWSPEIVCDVVLRSVAAVVLPDQTQCRTRRESMALFVFVPSNACYSRSGDACWSGSAQARGLRLEIK